MDKNYYQDEEFQDLEEELYYEDDMFNYEEVEEETKPSSGLKVLTIIIVFRLYVN